MSVGCWNPAVTPTHSNIQTQPLTKAQDSCGDWFVSMKGKGAGGWTKIKHKDADKKQKQKTRWIYNKIINIKTRKIMVWSSTSRLDKRQQEPLAHMHLWWKRCWIRWEVKRHNKQWWKGLHSLITELKWLTNVACFEYVKKVFIVLV